MKTWTFNNSKYTSIPLSRFMSCKASDRYFSSKNDLIKTIKDNHFKLPPFFDIDSSEKSVVYVPKYDKCYYLEYCAYCGNGNNLKAYLTDVYNEDDKFFLLARDVNIVFKIIN